MKCDGYEPSACRDTVFAKLVKISKKPGAHFWIQANTLQTVAQYWYTITDTSKKEDAGTIIVDGYKNAYEPNKNDKGFWSDDFGWWGGFFLDLRGYYFGTKLRLPAPLDDEANLLTQAKHCFEMMTNTLDPKYGGIWNSPDRESQFCRKNAVTNCWYLSLAANLAYILYLLEDPKSADEYRTEALNQYAWLNKGSWGEYNPPIGSWDLYTSSGVLRETPKGPSPTMRGPNNVPTPDWFWSGDDGVYLKGLQFLHAITADPKYLLEGQSLIKAATAQSKNIFVDEDNVMHESPAKENYDPNYSDWSYATGKGVFMRLATQFAIAKQPVDEEFSKFVKATAESVWCSRDESDGEISRNWNPPLGPPGENDTPGSDVNWPLVLQNGGLDALNAAVRINATPEEELPVTVGARTSA